jgi:lysozyme
MATETTVRISARGRAFIVREEGEVLHVYKDPLGYPTVCVGHLIKPGESVSAALSPAECDGVLERDLGPIEAALSTQVRVELAQCQIDSLGSWLFNVGTGALAKSAVLSAINGGRLELVPQLLEAWCKGGSPLHVLPYLLARRRREGAMFAEAFAARAEQQLPEQPRAELAPDEQSYLGELVRRANVDLLQQLELHEWSDASAVGEG